MSEDTTGATDTAGQGSMSVPIRISAAAVGVKAFLQAFVLDPSTPHGLAQTNGLELRVGK